MNLILVICIVIVIFVFNSNQVEKFWSRPNKCFDCEKQITSDKDAHLSFPTKCFSCEKQHGQIPYHTGSTKCFDCERNKKSKCNANVNDVGNYFTTFGRNLQMPGRF